MNFEILTNPADDPHFVELLKHLISRLVGETFPEQIFVMKIDNWFDHKWLNFSGKGRVGFFGAFIERDTALDEFRQDKVTFPPFTPNRVLGEYYFARDQIGSYVPSLAAPLVHQRKLATSSENLHKRVTDFADSALFIWASSNTKSNCRGSIMVYEVKDSNLKTWYLGLVKQNNWSVSRTKGINLDRAVSLIQTDVPQH